MRNYYYFGFLFGSVLTGLISILVLTVDHKKLINRMLGLLSICVFTWFIGRFLILTSKSVEQADFWQRFTYTATIFIAPIYTHFAYVYLRQKTRWMMLLAYIFASTLVILNYTTDLLISEMKPIPVLGYYEQAGPLFIVYLIYYIFLPTHAAFTMFKESKIADPIRKNQIKYITLASNIGFTVSLTTFPLAFGVNLPPIGGPFTAVYVFIISYAISVHRLLDFNLIIRWGMVFITSIVLIALIFCAGALIMDFSTARFLHLNSGAVTILVLSLSILTLDLIRKKVTRFVDLIIFKSPDYQNILIGIQKELENSKSIEAIATGLITQFRNIWNIEHAGFAIYNVRDANFSLWPPNLFSQQIIQKINMPILKTDFLIRTLETERRLFKFGIITEAELTSLGNRASAGSRTTFWKMRRTMRWLGAAICVPLMSDKELLGVLVLGPKKTNAFYGDEDKKFLSHIADMVCSGFFRSYVHGDNLVA